MKWALVTRKDLDVDLGSLVLVRGITPFESEDVQYVSHAHDDHNHEQNPQCALWH